MLQRNSALPYTYSLFVSRSVFKFIDTVLSYSKMKRLDIACKVHTDFDKLLSTLS